MLGDSINKSTKLKSDRFRSMWDGKIKGEKYDSPDFILGEVNGDVLLLRYNLYNDEFESKKKIMRLRNLLKELFPRWLFIR
jgi:hypothetical protein